MTESVEITEHINIEHASISV